MIIFIQEITLSFHTPTIFYNCVFLRYTHSCIAQTTTKNVSHQLNLLNFFPSSSHIQRIILNLFRIHCFAIYISTRCVHTTHVACRFYFFMEKHLHVEFSPRKRNITADIFAFVLLISVCTRAQARKRIVQLISRKSSHGEL